MSAVSLEIVGWDFISVFGWLDIEALCKFALTSIPGVPLQGVFTSTFPTLLNSDPKL